MSDELDDLRCLRDFEIAATRRLNFEAISYFSAAAGQNTFSKDNERAFERVKILPRVFCDVSSVDLSLSILGTQVPFPLGISPVAYQQLAHPAADMSTVKAAFMEEAIMIVSCGSSVSIEEISRRSPGGIKWLQIYIFKDRSLTRSLVEKAEVCGGYSALVVTADSPVRGLWHTAVPGTFFKNAAKKLSHLPRKLKDLLDSSLTFKDLAWLKSITRLPVIVKGIMTGEDAVHAIEHGASAIFVSNHGGRQIEGVSATVDVLEEVVSAVRKVNPEVEVYLDSGVRSGSDVFKALALGARAVFIGRPAIWGLSVAGKDGVKNVLNILKSELQATMALSGAQSLKHITRRMVIKDNCCSYCKL